MNKKAFSLIEVLVSIALFSIILIFLYDTLDMTTKSNQFYAQKLSDKKNKNNIKKVFFLDFINKNEMVPIKSEDNNENTILAFQTKNIYHNPFYTNITYLVTNENNLVRIESKIPFNKEKLYDSFFEDTYIDIIDRKVKKMKIEIKENKYSIYLEYTDKTYSIFSF